MEKDKEYIKLEDKSSKELKDFKEDFINGVHIVADNTKEFLETAFVNEYTKQLYEVGELSSDFQPAYWSQRGSNVHGYSLDEENDILYLFIAVYSNTFDIVTLTQTEIGQYFNKLEKFYEKALETKTLSAFDDSLPVYELALLIYKKQHKYSKIKYYLLSDKILSGRVVDISSKKVNNVDYTYHVWDISRLYRMNSSANKKEDIIIHFEEICDSPVYCLPTQFTNKTFPSYLFILPGKILYQIYDKYAARLLEQNVRTFLQVRGNVNKGIRNTILTNPSHFFAYNNGLTATAENIEFEETSGGLKIKTLQNLQIVNGGQTTASIFNAVRKDKADVSNVFVQVKLTIVNSKEAEEIVPKISEYANTQNKVNAADFFSNHPFHIKLQEFSRKLWAPVSGGVQRESKWFYERARGQYLDEQSNCTVAEKKRFILEYPKNQVFTKTDLAKYLCVWDEVPHIVARGAQYIFVEFAKNIQEIWDKNQADFNQFYFQNVISKVIIFQKTEYLVSRSSWYNGGFRAQIVAYTIALIARKINLAKLSVDYSKIWKNQSSSEAMQEQIMILAKEVYLIITQPPAGSANPSQWAKKIECWDKVKTIQIPLIPTFRKELLTSELIKNESKIAKNSQALDDKVDLEVKIYNIPAEAWQKVLEFGKLNNISDKEISLINVAMNKMKLPSDKQAIFIWQIVGRLKNIGMEIEGFGL